MSDALTAQSSPLVRQDIANGIEWFDTSPGMVDCQCARCGSSASFASCPNCEHGLSGHDCGEDCCACVHPEPNVPCDYCGGSGGAWHCISSPAWCKANPLVGRALIPSTALNAEAWNDVH